MYFGYGSGDGIYIILLLVVMGISFYAQSKVQKTFNQFAQVPVSSGLRAEEIAQQLLNRGNSPVQITPPKKAPFLAFFAGYCVKLGDNRPAILL